MCFPDTIAICLDEDKSLVNTSISRIQFFFSNENLFYLVDLFL